jgi:hypothetical protein
MGSEGSGGSENDSVGRIVASSEGILRLSEGSVGIVGMGSEGRGGSENDSVGRIVASSDGMLRLNEGSVGIVGIGIEGSAENEKSEKLQALTSEKLSRARDCRPAHVHIGACSVRRHDGVRYNARVDGSNERLEVRSNGVLLCVSRGRRQRRNPNVEGRVSGCVVESH